MFNRENRRLLISLLVITFFFSTPLLSQTNKALTLTDMMEFKHLHHASISENGEWITYNTEPDRGDGEVVVRAVDSKQEFLISRGDNPVFSKNARWVVAVVKPPFAETNKAKDKSKLKNGLALLNTNTGEITEFDNVKSHALSEDSEWLAYQLYAEADTSKNEKNNKSKNEKLAGTQLILRELEAEAEIELPDVVSFAFDSTSQFFAYSVADTSGDRNGLFYRELKNDPQIEHTILQNEDEQYHQLTWCNQSGKLAFLSNVKAEKKEEVPCSMWLWDSESRDLKNILPPDKTPDGWSIPEKNNLSWTRDGDRLFFGLKPKSMFDLKDDEKEEDEKEEVDIFDIQDILEKKEVDVWHWDDPLIIPHQKKQWSRLKDRTYKSVYFVDSDKFVQLADEKIPDVNTNENPNVALGLSDVPYLKEKTWDGTFYDVFTVDLKTGDREKILTHMRSRPRLSPKGKIIVYYDQGQWFIYDLEKKQTIQLTKNLDVPFANEDHDYPYPARGYGIGGWIKNDDAVFIYDKYDIWLFPTSGGEPVNITEVGRKSNMTYRIIKTDRDKEYFKKNERLLLSSYHQLEKNDGFYECYPNKPGVKKLLEEEKKFRFLQKAELADKMIFTRESYTEFPDIWISDLNFNAKKKLTNVNPQIKDFAWGSAELVEWNSVDGIPLQGVLIKPGNYQKGKKYPVLVYFYRLFSQRLHDFNQVVVNHRPCFPYYASNGYAIFLPDVRFEIGRPGFSATKCIVPGVQKLIEMGIADPNAIALHGHSWSGYQTAFMITQTDLFSCAIAGAPVSNMTSAYSGIRWSSGLARQFQYEMTQSRIGGSLWEYPERYIENSPVFFADRIHTPLLIMFGDEDGAVPWYQGIELYLAMRRLKKDCVFLQYRGEPHHPKKYANKLDYTIRMKAYLDHYCKGVPAEKWIKTGIPYEGK